MTSLTPRYSAEDLDYKFQYSSERLGIDPEKVKTADVAPSRFCEKRRGIWEFTVAATTSADRAGDDCESVRDGMLTKSIDIHSPRSGS